jgi:hypothetical protein
MFRGGNEIEIVGFFNAAVEVECFIYQVEAADTNQSIIFVSNGYGIKIAGAKMLPPALLVRQPLEGGIGDTFLNQGIPVRGQALKDGRANMQLRFQNPSDKCL